MIVLWRKAKYLFHVDKISDQLISGEILGFTQGNYKVLFVYGSTNQLERRRLWQELTEVQTQIPWVVLGDFNATLKTEERRGVRSVAGSYDEFLNCVEELELSDLPYNGCFFTWFNRRQGEEAIAAKLDRVLVNGSWI